MKMLKETVVAHIIYTYYIQDIVKQPNAYVIAHDVQLNVFFVYLLTVIVDDLCVASKLL